MQATLTIKDPIEGTYHLGVLISSPSGDLFDPREPYIDFSPLSALFAVWKPEHSKKSFQCNIYTYDPDYIQPTNGVTEVQVSYAFNFSKKLIEQ